MLIRHAASHSSYSIMARVAWSALLIILAAVVVPAALAQDPASKDTTTPETPSAQKGVQNEQVVVHPTEGYFAAFGGYTFGGKFDAGGTKAGGFFPESLNWFGVEAELYNTTPHIEQQGAAAGSHMRVTTLAINAIARAQFACEKKHLDTEQVTERFAFHYVTEFCRLQPYAGVGLGLYWVDISNSSFSAHANFVPGFNALAGIRYYFTDRIAMFTEYKYNRATFNFSGVQGLAGFEGVYSINHIVAGFSYHY